MRVAGSVEPAVIGWDQSVLLREVSRYAQTGHAGGGGQPGGKQFSARDFVHECFPDSVTRPVIMARTRLTKPARHTKKMWETTNNRDASDATK